MNPLLGEIAIPAALVAFWGHQLLHACWQGALLVTFIAVVCRVLPRLPAGARCFLWWLACLKLLLGLVWTTPLGVPLLPAPRPNAPLPISATAANNTRQFSGKEDSNSFPLSRVASEHHATTVGAIGPQIPGSVAPSSCLPLLTFLFTLWLAGVLVRVMLGLLPLRRVKQLLATSTVVNDPDILREMAKIANSLGLPQAPCLLLSEMETEPLAVSHWQNVVLLSRSDFRRLDQGELRAVLAHEFAHIRRADLWMGLIPFLTQTLFWFYPFAWLACYEFATSCEAACDAAALRVVHTPTRTYGELLLKLGTRHAPLGPVIARGATSQFRLLQRRLIMIHHTPRCSPRLLIPGLTALFVPIIGLGLIPWRLVAAQGVPDKPVTALTGNFKPSKSPAQTPVSVQERTGPTNLDFSQGLDGWRYDWADGSENYFDHGIDPSVRYDGKPSPFLYATANLPHIYGVISQWIDATPFRGKRLRFSAYIRTQGVKAYAGPMFGLVGGEHARNYILKNHPLKNDTDWKRYEYVADVDADTTSLVLGMNLRGKGKVWMNHLILEEVGKEVPLSPQNLAYSDENRAKQSAQPVNMDFMQGLQGWNRVEEGDNSTPSAYRIGLDRKQAQHGVPPAYLTSDGSQPNGYGTLVQYIDPAAYQGKRVRLSGLIKTQAVNKYAGLWVGMNGTGWAVWDAQHSVNKAPTDWTNVALVMDVPKDCTQLGLGVMVRGVGKLWVKHLALEVVGTDIAPSPVTLRLPEGN